MARLRRRPAGFRRRRTPRLQGLSLGKIIPNLITLMGLCAGLTAIRYGLRLEYEKAVLAVVFAMVFDGIDGRVARLLKGTSRFGAELDSLSDFVCFGVVPALLLYLWAMSDAGGLGWAVVLLFVVCCGLRLARFNTQLMGEKELPPWAYNYFTGVPAPAGAGLALIPMVITFATDWEYIFRSPIVVGAALGGVALLMLSRLPTFSFKKIRVPKAAVLPLMVGAGLLVGFLVTAHWITLSVMGLVYLAMIPISVLSFRRLERETRRLSESDEAQAPQSDPPATTRNQA